MKTPVLTDLTLPDFGMPTVEPAIPAATYAARLEALQRRAATASLDAVVVYGDREHNANIAWLTGYDPRFEEAICVVVPGRTPHLLVGNEGWGYAAAAKGAFERILWQPLSLMGQPRDKTRPLAGMLRDAGLKPGMRIGLAGWKGYEAADETSEPDWFETPHYLVNALAAFGPVVNAADIFMNPRYGLRAINDVDQLAAFEYAATLTSAAIRKVIAGIKPGMSEYDAVRLMELDGFPHSVHLMLSSGERTGFGLASPSSRRIEEGEPVVCAFGLFGGLNCRAGFLVRDASGLPAAIRDYVPKLVAPYFAAVAAWYEALGIGVAGGVLYEAVMSRIGDPFFGVGLNPGHLIHLDEWVHSPIRKGSRTPLASGMAIQCDVIPATGTDYFTTNIEDGIALADEPLRAAFAAKYPEAWSRIGRRRAFMTEMLGIALRPEVLPFSNMPAWLPPFWL
ncbi:MAG: aminopeptidase P family N-terminal domain-containing protein, partial [Bauldia sp.]